MSLNFAVFRSVFARGERLGAGPVLRIWRSVLLWASRFWQIESLYRANAKYQPEWVPRFVCFRSSADLPRVSVAALRAEAFLVAPTWVQRFVRSDGYAGGATDASGQASRPCSRNTSTPSAPRTTSRAAASG